MNVSSFLTCYLKDHRISQAELARLTGLTPAAISQIINGLREPSLETLIKICDALIVTPNDMLGYTRQTIMGMRTKVSDLENKLARIKAIVGEK